MKKIIMMMILFVLNVSFGQDIIKINKNGNREIKNYQWVIGLTQQIPITIASVVRDDNHWKIIDKISIGYSQSVMLYKSKYNNGIEIYQPIVGIGLVLSTGYQEKSPEVSGGGMVSVGNISGAVLYNFVNKNIVFAAGAQYNIPSFIEIWKR